MTGGTSAPRAVESPHDGTLRPRPPSRRAGRRSGSASTSSTCPTPRPARTPRRPVLRARDAALPLGGAAHGPRQELHDGRRRHALPAPARRPRHAPDGLRRVRAAGRERGHPLGPPPGRVDPREHRRHPPPDEADGLVDRLEPRALDRRSGVLPLDAVDLPAPVRGRPRVPQERGRQVVPERPDGAGQRAGDRRALRALRRRGRGAHAGAVVLQDHRLRRPAAGRPRAGELARAGRDDAAQLDRPLARRRGRVRGSTTAPTCMCSPPGPTRSSAPRSSCSRPSTRGRSSWPTRSEHSQAVADYIRHAAGRSAVERAEAQREDRRLHRPLRHEPGERRADPGVGGRLRPGRVRHRRDHGRARPRRARLRVRRGARARDPAGGGSRAAPSLRRTSPTSAHSQDEVLDQLGRVHRHGRPGRRRRRSSPGSRPTAAARARSPTACATGCCHASATGAARSRSCTARAAGSWPFPTTSCRWSCPTSRTSRRAAARRWRRPRTGCGRSARPAAAPPRARRTRWTRSSTRPGTTCATPTRTTTRPRSAARPSTRGCPSTSTSAGSSTRSCT